MFILHSLSPFNIYHFPGVCDLLACYNDSVCVHESIRMNESINHNNRLMNVNLHNCQDSFNRDD